MLLSNVVLSQTTDNIVQQKISYNFSDGYNITNPNSAAYDKLGWLWIIGNNYEKTQFRLGENKLIMQRFDGTGFYNVNFPNKTTKVTSAFFIKNKQDLYLFLLYQKAPSELYKIDADNLGVKLVKEYSKLLEKSIKFRG